MPESSESKYVSETFGQRLRELSERESSYSQVARDLGINRQQFARYLNGSSRPRDALVRKIAEYFRVDSGDLFRDQPIGVDDSKTPAAASAISSALLEGISRFDHEPIPESDLPSGVYMQYKQSFTQPTKIVLMLCKVFRDKSGVARTKRRYSVRVTRELPGVRVSHTSYGVFVRNLGALLLFESDAVAGDLVMSSFKPSPMFSMSKRISTGLVMTHGRPGSLGPVAGRHILEKVPEGESLLGWARLQGFRAMSELPSYIQFHLEPPEHVPANMLASR